MTVTRLNARQRAQTHLDQSMSLSSFHVENADAARRSTVVTLDPRDYSANTGTSNSSMSKCEDEEAHGTPSTTLGRKTGRGLGDLVGAVPVVVLARRLTAVIAGLQEVDFAVLDNIW